MPMDSVVQSGIARTSNIGLARMRSSFWIPNVVYQCKIVELYTFRFVRNFIITFAINEAVFLHFIVAILCSSI